MTRLLTALLVLLGTLGGPGVVNAQASSLIRIERSRLFCELRVSGNRILVRRPDGTLRVKRFGTITRRLASKAVRLSDEINALLPERLGQPSVEARIARLHMRRYLPTRGYHQVTYCRTTPEWIDDYANRGSPVVKERWTSVREHGFQPAFELPAETAEEAFTFDSIDYFVRSKRVHGTQVLVAIHRDAIEQANVWFAPGLFAQAIIRMFHELRHVHDGYVGEEYVFKIRAPGVAGVRYRQGDLPTILEDLTGSSFTELLDRYIGTNAPLTEVLDGEFELMRPNPDTNAEIEPGSS